MELRLHLAMVIDLGACLGCQRCALACLDARPRSPGSEHLWHAHVEQRPGAGHPAGWLAGTADLGLRQFGEPFGWDPAEVLDAPPGDLRPAAAPRSRLTGAPLPGRRGPLSPGSLASDEPTGRTPSPAFFHLPRLCNHCLAPSCVERCPSGALRQRRSDGAVFADASRCASDGGCWSACPYAKATLDLGDGRSSKCDLCRDRLDQGRAPACVEVCPARLMGPLLVDASRIAEAKAAPERELAARQRALVLDAADVSVAQAAKAQRIDGDRLDCLLRSPVLPLVASGLALPLLPGLRTLPSVFYVPPRLPQGATKAVREPLDALFGDELRLAEAKLEALRAVARAASVGDLDVSEVERRLEAAQLTREQAERLGALLRSTDPAVRVVIPSPSRGGAR